LDKEKVIEMMNSWLDGFKLKQPSEFFKDHPTNDSELVCSIQTEMEFMLSTLEFFGLPKGYIDGKGHFPNWEKERLEAKKKKGAKGAKKQNKAIAAARAKKGLATKADEDAMPTYFDITVFKNCLSKFLGCNGKVRSTVRQMLLEDLNKTHKVF